MTRASGVICHKKRTHATPKCWIGISCSLGVWMKMWWHYNARFVYQSNSPKCLLSEMQWIMATHLVFFLTLWKNKSVLYFSLCGFLLRHVLLNWKGEYICHIRLALLKGNIIKRSTLWLCGLCKRWRNWTIRCSFCVRGLQSQFCRHELVLFVLLMQSDWRKDVNRWF